MYPATQLQLVQLDWPVREYWPDGHAVAVRDVELAVHQYPAWQLAVDVPHWASVTPAVLHNAHAHTSQGGPGT